MLFALEEAAVALLPRPHHSLRAMAVMRAAVAALLAALLLALAPAHAHAARRTLLVRCDAMRRACSKKIPSSLTLSPPCAGPP